MSPQRTQHKTTAAAVLGSLAAAGYDVIKAASDGSPLPRELRALVEFEVALRAERFLGNSVSTFSAAAILERRRSGRWAGYYNGGDIPLVQVFPLFDLPWVFTFNRCGVTLARLQRPHATCLELRRVRVHAAACVQTSC